jgi:DNA-binding transcriptional ArsR family regulator
MTPRQADQVALLFKVLGNPFRVRLLAALADGREVRLSELGLSSSAASAAARPLVVLGLVARRRKRQEVYYRLTGRGVMRLLALGLGLTGADGK